MDGWMDSLFSNVMIYTGAERVRKHLSIVLGNTTADAAFNRNGLACSIAAHYARIHSFIPK